MDSMQTGGECGSVCVSFNSVPAQERVYEDIFGY